MTVLQFVHTLNYGDAISGEALLIRDLCREAGFSSEIYCLHCHKELEGEGIIYRGQELPEDAVMILHHSIDSPLNEVFKSYLAGTRWIIYHNLTPSHWFTEYNARVEQDLIKGREELPGLLQTADLVLADSSYNAGEIAEFCKRAPQVLSLPLTVSKWSSVTTNAGIAAALRGTGGANILHVGRIAPNKCIEDVIKSFYFFHHKTDKKSKLWLVGIDIDTELYAAELRNLTYELGLHEAVEFVGGVSDDELKAFYQGSDAYLCMSEHEGFCLPLLEAMYFELPVIAFQATAVTETLGEAGVLFEEKRPALIAETLAIILADKEQRKALVAQGKRRLTEFSEVRFREELFSTLSNSAEATSNARAQVG